MLNKWFYAQCEDSKYLELFKSGKFPEKTLKKIYSHSNQVAEEALQKVIKGYQFYVVNNTTAQTPIFLNKLAGTYRLRCFDGVENLLVPTDYKNPYLNSVKFGI